MVKLPGLKLGSFGRSADSQWIHRGQAGASGEGSSAMLLLGTQTRQEHTLRQYPARLPSLRPLFQVSGTYHYNVRLLGLQFRKKSSMCLFTVDRLA
jgi:hypothetical protein